MERDLYFLTGDREFYLYAIRARLRRRQRYPVFGVASARKPFRLLLLCASNGHVENLFNVRMGNYNPCGAI